MKACDIIKSLRETLHSKVFQNKHKSKDSAFSRRPVLDFTMLFTFILKGIKNSLQTDIFNFLDTISLSEDISKQAFSNARKKLLPSAFIELNDQLVYEFYKKNNKVIKWEGYIVLVADGSTIQLPNHKKTKNKYGFSVNQSTEEVPLARSIHVYDPLNKITICGSLNPYNSGESDGLIALMNKILVIKQNCRHEKILILLDRHYPSYKLMQLLTHHGIDFVMRCKKDFTAGVKSIVRNNIKDSTTYNLWNSFTSNQKNELINLNILPQIKLPLRVLLVDLPESEDEKFEVLLTSLIDKEQFKYNCFKGLYFNRWDIEESIKFLKLQMEIENFGGMTPYAVEQEFHASILASNIRAVLANEAQELLDEKSLNQKHKKIINKNISLSALKLDLIEILLNPKSDIEDFCNKIKRRMLIASITKRPGRKYSRVRKRIRKKFYNHQRRAAG